MMGPFVLICDLHRRSTIYDILEIQWLYGGTDLPAGARRRRPTPFPPEDEPFNLEENGYSIREDREWWVGVVYRHLGK
jgi:hypothetical protein